MPPAKSMASLGLSLFGRDASSPTTASGRLSVAAAGDGRLTVDGAGGRHGRHAVEALLASGLFAA